PVYPVAAQMANFSKRPLLGLARSLLYQNRQSPILLDVSERLGIATSELSLGPIFSIGKTSGQIQCLQIVLLPIGAYLRPGNALRPTTKSRLVQASIAASGG